MSTTLTATYKDVQVVREFVRQLYGFDKGKISDFINKTRVQCECLMHIHQAQFIAPRTFISHSWSGFQPRGHCWRVFNPMNTGSAFGFELDFKLSIQHENEMVHAKNFTYPLQFQSIDSLTEVCYPMTLIL